MNDSPLWSKDEANTYWLLFPNKHALSRDEIREIFSKYGKVLNLTAAGDERGFRFVQFGCLEDVERAVENLKNHPTVNLIQHRPKKKQQNSQNSNSNNKETSSNPRRNFYQRKSTDKNSSSTQLADDLNDLSIHNEQNSFQDDKNLDNSAHNDTASVCSNTPKRTVIPPANASYTSPQSNRLNQLSTPKTAAGMSPSDWKLKLLKVRGTHANTFPPPSSQSSSLNASANNVKDDEIPNLVSKDQIGSNKEPRKLIFNAEEVIVANIHDEYGSAFILHLLDEYEPLAVTYIKVLPGTETRYCHVYFKSVTHSIEVETHFDGYELEGKELLVLRPCTLMEEAMCGA